MKKIIILAVLVLLVTPVFAQQSETVEPEKKSAMEQLKDRIRKAAHLPEAAQEAREAGIPEGEVAKVIDEARRRKMPVDEVDTVLAESAASARKNGPVDNYGAFVQSQLDKGLRGRELRDAIHAEHAARGKGHMKREMKGEMKGEMKAKHKGEMKSEMKGKKQGSQGEAKGKGKGNAKGQDGQKRKQQ